ncbi:MAG: glycosyltransferase family 4 protein [Candidatus Magasanikbacteria bacterium]|nr:glycosyltransferase family 4 protein [Candidatus Magasanikbacteria bacterium]
MNIAMIGQKGLPAIHGGVERHVEELSTRLVRYGHNVTVYARRWYTTKSTDQNYAGIKIKHLPSINTKNLDTITHTFLATIHAILNRADVIHYHGVGPSLWSWIPRLISPKTIIVTTFHCIDRKHEKWGRIGRIALTIGEWTSCHFAHRTVAVSRTIEQYARDLYDTKTAYIPNGANTLNLNSKSTTGILDRYQLRPKEYIILVARFIPHKGIHTAIHAFNNVCAEAPEVIRNRKLVIVGDGHHTDSYVKMLRTMAKKNPNIIFTGFQHGENLTTLMANATALIHPSFNEGLPLTVLEAMGLGLPVLLSDIPEHRELGVSDQFIFPTNNLSALAGALVWLLQTNERDLKEASTKNRAIVEKQYNWDTIVGTTNALYREAISKPVINKHIFDTGAAL